MANLIPDWLVEAMCWLMEILEVTKDMSEQRQELVPQWLLEIMCCPVPECRGDLELRADIERLVCKKCGRRYPIRNGIPVMLIEEAELPTSEGQL
jgi:uncharacterized protein YbaR (Trm112 family)